MSLGSLLLAVLAKLGFIRIGKAQVAVTKAETPAKLDGAQVVTAAVDAAIGAPATLQTGVVQVTEQPYTPPAK